MDHSDSNASPKELEEQEQESEEEEEKEYENENQAQEDNGNEGIYDDGFAGVQNQILSLDDFLQRNSIVSKNGGNQEEEN